MKAIILAGGKGTRLTPYTTVFPKPLMPLDGFPILHIVITQLKKYGFCDITLAVGHLAEMIRTYFGDGSKFGVNIKYSKEDCPLGTVGALSLIEGLPDNFLLMNGDILTTLNFSELTNYHLEQNAMATIATHNKEVKIDYGVIKCDGCDRIIGYDEKPEFEYPVSMGVYVFNRSVMRYVTTGKYLDFPDLIKILISKGEKVIRFPFSDYWMDIGCHNDYERAVKDFESRKGEFLGEGFENIPF